MQLQMIQNFWKAIYVLLTIQAFQTTFITNNGNGGCNSSSSSLFLFCSANVISLTQQNFEPVTTALSAQTTGSMLIIFKLQHCIHCERMVPEYEKLAHDQLIKQNDITVATVDATSNKKLSLRFRVREYPTVIYLHRGRLYRYEGPRYSADMRSFALKGYENQGKGEAIPPQASFFGQILEVFVSGYDELNDAAQGKVGMLGYALVGMVGILIGLMLFTIYMFCYVLSTGALKHHLAQKEFDAKVNESGIKVKTN